jgi:hypothetical protein
MIVTFSSISLALMSSDQVSVDEATQSTMATDLSLITFMASSSETGRGQASHCLCPSFQEQLRQALLEDHKFISIMPMLESDWIGLEYYPPHEPGRQSWPESVQLGHNAEYILGIYQVYTRKCAFF